MVTVEIISISIKNDNMSYLIRLLFKNNKLYHKLFIFFIKKECHYQFDYFKNEVYLEIIRQPKLVAEGIYVKINDHK